MQDHVRFPSSWQAGAILRVVPQLWSTARPALSRLHIGTPFSGRHFRQNRDQLGRSHLAPLRSHEQVLLGNAPITPQRLASLVGAILRTLQLGMHEDMRAIRPRRDVTVVVHF